MNIESIKTFSVKSLKKAYGVIRKNWLWVLSKVFDLSKEKRHFFIVAPQMSAFPYVHIMLSAKVRDEDGLYYAVPVFVNQFGLCYNAPSLMSVIAMHMPDVVHHYLVKHKKVSAFGFGVWLPSWFCYSKDVIVTAFPPSPNVEKVMDNINASITEALNAGNAKQEESGPKDKPYGSGGMYDIHDLHPSRTIN